MDERPLRKGRHRFVEPREAVTPAKNVLMLLLKGFAGGRSKKIPRHPETATATHMHAAAKLR